MFGIIGFWESQQRSLQSGRDVDLQCWRENMKAFGGTHLILIDVDNLNPTVNDTEIIFEKFPTLIAALDKYKTTKKFVFLEFKTDIPAGVSYFNLKTFTHPLTNVFYIVGSDNTNLNLANLNTLGYLTNNYVVTVDTGLAFGYSISNWAHVISAVALYDRLAKGV